MKNRATVAGRRARAAGLGLVAWLFGCGATPEVDLSVDVDRELDLLWGCALLEVARSGREIANASSDLRVVTSRWEERAVEGTSERSRIQVTVFAHPWFGPGLTVLHARDRARVGADDASPPGVATDDPGGTDRDGAEGEGVAASPWEPQPQTPGDAQVEAELTHAIQGCWMRERAGGDGAGGGEAGSVEDGPDASGAE